MIFNNFTELKSHFIECASIAFSDAKDRRRGEQICSIAMRTSDDVMGASLHCDTIERRERRYEQSPKNGTLAKLARSLALEWETEGWDELYTRESPATRHPRIDISDEFRGILEFQLSRCSENRRSVRRFRRDALRAMVDALAELDRQGAFGRDSERDQVILFVEITDSYDAYFCLLESVRLLNPSAARRRFYKSFPLTMRLLLAACFYAHWFFRGRVISSRSPQ